MASRSGHMANKSLCGKEHNFVLEVWPLSYRALCLYTTEKKIVIIRLTRGRSYNGTRTILAATLLVCLQMIFTGFLLLQGISLSSISSLTYIRARVSRCIVRFNSFCLNRVFDFQVSI